MTVLANDIGVARRTVVTVIAELVRGGKGLPIAVARETGRKLRGHRREANTYVLSIRSGWALDAYKTGAAQNGASVALGQNDHQSSGDLSALTIGQEDHQVGDPVAQVLPSSLPKTSAKEEIAPNGARPFELVPEPRSEKRRPTKPIRPTTRSLPMGQPSEHRALLDAYVAEFQKARNVDPITKGPPWKRTCKAAKDLLDSMPLEDAIAIVRRAFAEKFFRETQGELHQIASSPNKYCGKAASNGIHHRGAAAVQCGIDLQRSATAQELIAREREATTTGGVF